MKYFYEYKEKNGCVTAGHNLEKIVIKNNVIFLVGVENNFDNYHILLDMNDDIEYLKIIPMKEEEEYE